MSSLFVGNLSSHVRHRELENSFRRFGRCSLELKEGFGFVVFEDHRDATRALEALQGRSLCGEQPSISWARKRRPFQRFSGKGNFVGRERYHSRRRPSVEADQGSDDGRRDQRLVDEMKDGVRASEVRDESVRSTERDAEWKDSAPERSMCDEETKDADPLDSGRWDPHMEGSPDNILVEGLLEDEQHPSDDKDKEDERGSLHEKLQGSPRDRHHDRPSRVYRNSSDQHNRGRDAFDGRQQERCYNCGQSGHVKWQCRSRPRRMHIREGGYDGRRNDFRYPGSRGGFRGVGGNGRFRGSNGSRRILTRDIEPGYVRRSRRRHDVNIDRKHSNPVDTKTREKSRRRHHRSESPQDSSSRGRSKRKHKQSNKKSTRSKIKRQRSSSASPSSSRSPRSASSSLRTRSHSGSKSQSSKSDSQLSGSSSRSSSSVSQSSRSRSLSASSSSRSRSASSQSKKSVSKSISRSPSSHSPASRGIASPPSKAKRAFSPRSSSTGGSQISAYADDKEKAISKRLSLQDKEAHEMAIDDDKEKKDNSSYFSECQDVDQQDAQRTEKRRVCSREAKKQKMQPRSDDEERPFEAETQTNGVAHAVNSIKADDSYSREPLSLKGSEAILQGQVPDMGLSMYVAVMKEGGRGADGGQDWANFDFGAARLWPWEAMLYRRLKRGPISTANYERRKAQNEEFGIKDTFVRSSSGWWENRSE